MIEICGLTKRFGDTLAVDNLSFTVCTGQVTGFPVHAPRGTAAWASPVQPKTHVVSTYPHVTQSVTVCRVSSM